MWFGWALACTLLKFEPVLSALSDWPKNTFQTVVRGATFEFTPLFDLE